MEAHTIKHIGIIMDGNRRYARKQGILLFDGHKKGAEKLKEVLNWIKEYKIPMVTLYTLSYENKSRPKEEMDALMDLFKEGFSELIKNKDDLNKDGIKIHFIGRTDFLPKDVCEMMQKLVMLTKDNNKLTVNFALGYSGRTELVDAVRKIIHAGMKEDDVTEETIMQNLYLASEPELIIRTGKERRMSNFLTYQSVYSELFFLDCLWPEFSKEEFDNVIAEFNKRERRYGK